MDPTLLKSRAGVVIRRIGWGGVLTHAGFFSVFVWLGPALLAAVAAVSVVLWLVAIVVNRSGRSTLAMWLLIAAVIVHSLTAVQLLGWHSGFAYYLIPLVPFAMTNERLRATVALCVGFGIAAMFVLLYALAPAAAREFPYHRALSYLNMLLPLLVLCLVAFEFRLVSMQVEVAVATMALTDPLTGLANRRLMGQRLRQEQARTLRTKSPFCVIMADIDHFKHVNDTHGHEVGDRVLIEVGKLLTSALRTQDIVARWGGEEFLVVLPDTPLAAAEETAERLRKLAETQLGAQANVGTTTLTFGVAQCESSITECLKRADEALYRGKTDGRNQVVVAKPEATEESAAG